MLTERAKHIKRLVKSKGVLQMGADEIRTLVEIHRDLFREKIPFSDPLTGAVEERWGLNWKRMTAQYVHDTLKKHKRI